MLYYALMFLVVGVIAGALNMAGVAAVAVQISWILFLIGIVLLAMSSAVISYTAMTGAPQSPEALQLSVPVSPGKSVVA